jgi:hypothetical protein
MSVFVFSFTFLINSFFMFYLIVNPISSVMQILNNLFENRFHIIRLLYTFTFLCPQIYCDSSFQNLVPFYCENPPRPDRLCGPPSLLSNGYQGLFPWG